VSTFQEIYLAEYFQEGIDAKEGAAEETLGYESGESHSYIIPSCGVKGLLPG
jgi:hypothetical protein